MLPAESEGARVHRMKLFCQTADPDDWRNFNTGFSVSDMTYPLNSIFFITDRNVRKQEVVHEHLYTHTHTSQICFCKT